ncbi:Hrp1 protein [Martiniozyma asiatica (nom. inval.)]|nr:Hrp1 protein [Martiniozyma asiatica]
MSANFDDDEALFDDIYDEAPKSASLTGNSVTEPTAQSEVTGTNTQTQTQPLPDVSAALASLSHLQSTAQPSNQEATGMETGVSANAAGASDLLPATTTTTTTTAPTTAVAPPANMDFSNAFAQLSQTLNQQQQYPDSNPSTQNFTIPPGMPSMPGMDSAMMQQFQQQMQQMMQQGQDKFQDSDRADLAGKDVGKMFIGGLNWETDEARLREYFSSYGTVTEANVMRDSATGKSRGFAFLTFTTADSVDKVLSEKHILDGKLIDPKRAIPREEQEKIGKVFVGGVAPDVTTQDFRDYFEQFGNIIDSQLMINKDTGKSRGYGFVTYDSAEAVERCTKDKFVMFHGKRMEVKKAEPRQQHNNKKLQTDSPMGNSMMMGDMSQYMQQMQQMQQMWMQQMQQMQQNGEPQQMMMNPMMMGMMGMNGMPVESQSHDQYEDDDVPNPQEGTNSSLPPPPPPPQGQNQGSNDSNSPPGLPSGPKRMREKSGDYYRGDDSNDDRRGGYRDDRRSSRRGGGGGGRGGPRRNRSRGGRGGFHPYRR